MKNLNLKNDNRKQVLNYFNGEKHTLEGLKLRALYRLIQIKGERIKAPAHKMNGVKVAQITSYLYGGMKWTNFGPHFYPAKIDAVTLTPNS